MAATLVLVAAQQLQFAAQSGRPFEREWTALRDVATPGALSNGARETLSSHAGRGVMPRSELRAGLQAARAPTLARGEDAGWMEWAARTSQDALARFGFAQASPGGRTELTLRRMEALVARGQLGEALGDAEALPAGAQTALAGWLAQASARAAVDHVVSELVLRGLQAGRPPV